MKHLKYLSLLLLAVVLVVGLTACSSAMVDPDDMPDVPELPQSFTVTFADRDGNVIKTQQVREGEAATPPSAAKVPEVPDHAFAGWDADINAITGDITVRPVYEKIRFAVEFHAQDGRLLAGVKVDRGQTPAAPQTAQIEGYHFVGWSDGTTLYPEVPVPTDDMTLVATYEINLYEVTFVDAMGEVKTTVAHGSDATAPEARVPAGKRFDGWDVDFTSVTGNLTVNARYVTVHTVTFVDWDGTQIGAPQVIDEGTDAVAPADPARAGHTFAGWDKVFVNVGTDIEVKALYTINQYTVTFLDADGTELKVKTTDYGTAVIAPATNAPEGMLFVRWVDENGHEVSDFSFTAADLTVKAVYARAITVVFMSRDGAELARFVVPEGSSVTAPDAPAVEGMRFTGWDNGYENVTENVTVTAQYVKVWTVIFLDHDGTQLGDAQIVDEDTAAVAPADPANKEGHHFTAWDTAFDAVTSDLTVKALYEINTYTVRFVDWMGNQLGAPQTINWNAPAAAPDAPAREDWTFDKWDRAFEAVTEDMTVTATYTPNFNPIYNQEDLANLKNAASGSFWGLMGDIDVSNWTSVALPAGVTFTGDGHTISGLTKPLFSTITGENTVKNLTVSGEVKLTTSAGMLAIDIKGSTLIANVTAEGSVTGTNAGGIVANVTGNVATVVTFLNCTNNATVTSTSGRAGGILASISGSKVTSAVNFASCVNNGTVTAKTNAGGILGFAYRCGDINLDNCENHAVITGANGVGGLVGASSSGTNPCNRLTITYSTNDAAITGTTYVGGLVGQLDGANARIAIENCVNLGNVTGETYVGGVAGYSWSSNNGNSVIYLRGVAVYADVTATTGYAGGLLGRVGLQPYAEKLQTVIEGCLVSGTVTTPDAAAAVIGAYYKDSRSATQTASVSLASSVFDVTLVCEGQKAAVIGKYEVKSTNYVLTVTGADTCLFTEALASGVTYYDSTGAVTTEGLVAGSPTLEYFNAMAQSVNNANTWAASRWVNVDGKLLPRAHAYTYYFYGEDGKLLLVKTVDDTAHVAFPRTGTSEGSAISDRVGYGVSAWTVDGVEYTKTNGFKALVTDSDKIVVASAYTLYKYTIQFNNAGNKKITSFSVDYGSAVTKAQLVTVTVPTIEGKIFVGWTYSGKLYTNDEVLAMATPAANVTFKATYVDEMVVTFQDADGVEIATCKTPVNGTIVAPDDPVKDGYSFLGWTTDDGATLVSKADIDQLIITESVTYKAVFVPLSITVIFKDGDTVLSEKEVDWGTTLTPPTLETPAGMVFVGWLADNDDVTYTAADFEGDDAYVATSSVTFTAVWGEVTTVTFIDEHYTSDVGDHVWATQTIGRGGKATVPATPANYAGMTFVGWSDGTNTYSEAELADLVINQDTTFTAFYTNVTYTVTFKNNDGKVYTTATVGDGACAIAPETPVKVMPEGIPSSCFKFAGWTYKGTEWNFDTPVTGDMELVAAYEFDANNASGVIGISDKEGLKAIDQNKIYVLTDDIDMTGWQTISLGSYSTNSTAEKTLGKIILCGDGHKLTNLTANLFQFVSYDMDIMNLVVEEPTISLTGSNAVASVFMQAFRANNLSFTDVSIKNCNLQAAYIGGFVCDFYNNVTFTRCTITGTLTGGSNNAAGVGAFTNNANANPSNKKLASNTKQSTIKFDGCISNVEIISKNNEIRYAGALISNNTLAKVKIEAKNCTLNTVITVTASKTVKNYGSIVGYFKASVAGTSLKVDGCTVTGTYKGNPIKVISEKGGTPATYIITNTTNNGESADTE